MRRALVILAGVALVAVVTIGLISASNPSNGVDSSGAQAAGPASNAKPVFLDGGKDAYEKRLASERGTPVVVNKWASWCGPCRVEFPFFGDQAQKRKGQVAFLGVNSNDSDGPAEDFVREHPVPFPHFRDPKLEIAATFNAVQAFPATAFYDRKGELQYVHQGQYPSEAELADDIDRYAR